MKKWLVALFLAGSVFHVEVLQAQPTNPSRYASFIDESDLKRHLFELASDAYEGRETGMAGQKKAANYIASYYDSLGLPAVVDGSYFQTYPLKREKYSRSTLTGGGKQFVYINDFFFFGSDQPLSLSVSDFVFAGYGIEEETYNDYKNIQVQGKIVMCLAGEPLDRNGNSIFTGNTAASEWSDDFRKKVDLAKSKGAKALLLVDPEFEQYLPRIRYWLEQPRLSLDYPSNPEATIPYCFVSPGTANALLAAGNRKRSEDYARRIQRKKKPLSFVVDTKVQLNIVHDEERMEAENVLGFIEGSDPLLKHEVVVISAHYDHIGIVNGQINNGADDDASGTVSTLEIAEAFVKASKEGNGPRRSVLILNVSGEEKGLLGSEWYAAYPIYPLQNTVCNLNIDMIGRIDEAHQEDPNYVYLIGSDKLSTSLHAISEQSNSLHTQLKLDYTYNDPEDPNRFYYRSDHYNFAKNNIPVIFYFSGVHEDYHQPGDDAEKILFDKMTTIARLVFFTAWEVANRDERPKVDVVSDFK
jgi:hypothetical protein